MYLTNLLVTLTLSDYIVIARGKTVKLHKKK